MQLGYRNPRARQPSPRNRDAACLTMRSKRQEVLAVGNGSEREATAYLSDGSGLSRRRWRRSKHAGHRGPLSPLAVERPGRWLPRSRSTEETVTST
jgi:hypothetical protein